MDQTQANPAPEGVEQATAEELRLELERARREIEELRDKYRRTAAEVANVRRWTEREVQARATKEQRDFLRQLLEVLDNLGRVLQTTAEPGIEEGIQITFRQLERILEKAGVTQITVKPGDKFNPEFHEAVDVRNMGIGQALVYRVVQPGYMHQDVLLRPARVIVQQ
jgi:molecular chaperone GrpE